MICGYYENMPFSDKDAFSLEEVNKIRTLNHSEIEYSPDLSSQLISINLLEETISIDDLTFLTFRIFSSEHTPSGNFCIAEKWKYPYWKKNGKVYLPGERNPIGEHLIILADKNSLEKIKYSIHSYPKNPFGGRRMGCIRMIDRDMKNLFNYAELGADVEIVR